VAKLHKDVTSLPDGATAGSTTLKVTDISHYEKGAFDPIAVVEKDNTRGEIAYVLTRQVDASTLTLHEAIKSN